MIRIIENGLELLSSVASPESGFREIFYALLLAEILRGNELSLKYRLRARNVVPNVGTDLFDIYMKIVDATQVRAHVDSFSGVTIPTPEISNKRHMICSTDWLDEGVSWDDAMAAIGLDSRDLDDKTEKFLYRVSLKEIMKKHGIWPMNT
ncbi:hypothetical protein FLL64_19120 [Vibrio cholerae]|nr:hypothetical protein FLL64_19120 [Vibrio cholerae]